MLSSRTLNTVLIVEGENTGTVAVVQKRDPLMISGGAQLTLVTKKGKNLWVHEDRTILLVESRCDFHICQQRSGRYTIHDAKGAKVLGFYLTVKDAADAIDEAGREAMTSQTASTADLKAPTTDWPVRGIYGRCKGCGDMFPASALNTESECLDCERYDPLDHEDEPVQRKPLAPEDEPYV